MTHNTEQSISKTSSLFKDEEIYEYSFLDSSSGEINVHMLDKQKGDALLLYFYTLQKFNNFFLLYHSLTKTISNYQNFLSNLKFGDRKYYDYANLNAFLISTLSIFYSLIEYAEYNFDYFKNVLKQKIHSSFYSYRLFYNLRVYLTHKGLAILKIQSLYTNNGFKTEAIVDAQLLIECEKLNAKFREELTLKNKEIKISDYLNEFKQSIDTMVFDIINHYKGEQVLAFKGIKNFLAKECDDYKDSILKDCKGELHGLLKSLNNYISIFTQEIIYRNEIDQHPDQYQNIYSLLNELSEIYFNEKNVIVKKEI